MCRSNWQSPASPKTFCFLFALLAAMGMQWDAIAGDWPVGRGNASSTATSDSNLPAKPELLWEYKADSNKQGFEGTPIIYDGKVILGDFEGTIHAIDLITGKAVWKEKKKDGFITSAAANQECVVIGDFSGRVYCLNAKTGKEIWVREIEQSVASGANFYGTNVLLTTEGGTMVALNLQSGEQIWSYATGDQLKSSPSIWKDFSMLGGCDGKLHKINIAKGEAVGQGVALQAPTLSTPSIIGKIAIVPTHPGVVFAIDVETEKILWTFSDPEMASDIRSSPAAQGKFDNDQLSGIAVVSSRNRRVLGIDLRNGKVLWEALLKKRAEGSPVLCAGRAWIGATDGIVYAIDLETGKETWSYQVAGQILSSPAIAADRLVIATEKGSVFCFGKK